MSEIKSNKRKILRKQLIERDGLSCWICGQLLVENLTETNPFRISIDHILDKALGGSNKIENLKLAHSKCNEKRALGRSQEIWKINCW